MQRELYVGADEPSAMSTYERLLGSALVGDRALFTDVRAVLAAWEVVDPVLDTHAPAILCEPGSWGPEQADQLIADDGGWQNPGDDRPQQPIQSARSRP